MKAKDSQNESALVCAARDGDRDALETLLTRHWPWLKALAYGVLGEARELDDVMQEVCLRVIARIHTLRAPECFRSWLAVIARREALKYCQRRARGPVEIDTDSEVLQTAPQDEGPLEELERREQQRQILEAVEGLPQIYREVFLLAYAGELTYAQMAEVLGVPITTMQIRLVRARRMIHQQVVGNSEREVQKR